MLHKHVIIEGPDGAGKSTLALAFTHLGYRYRHEGPPPKGASAFEHYARLFAEAKKPTVFDRFHLGELVYGHVLRGESELSHDDVVRLTRLVTGTGTPIIFCYPPWATCEANSAKKDEFIKSKDLRGSAYDRWAVIADRYDANLQVYDYTEDRLHVAQYDRLPDGVVGAPAARFLIVGEQPNGTLDLPFFGTKSSSMFLHHCLKEAGVNEWDVAFTNALDSFGFPRKLNLLMMGMSPRLKGVALLGKVAADQFKKQCGGQWNGLLSVRELPHPQYWLRFKHSRLDEYVLKLKAAYQMSW